MSPLSSTRVVVVAVVVVVVVVGVVVVVVVAGIVFGRLLPILFILEGSFASSVNFVASSLHDGS